MPLSKIVANSITDDTITTDQIADDSVHGRRNLFINGAMAINQRNTTGQPVGGYGYGVDRWRGYNSGTARYDLSQEAITDLQGFSHCYKLAVTTTQSSYGSDISVPIEQSMEGHTTAHLSFGTSNARSVTISFYVKSSVTGDFACALFNGSPITRSIVQNWTVNTADTWERKTITFAGDTSGTWRTDNLVGAYVALASIGGSAGTARASAANTWEAGYKNHLSTSDNIFATSSATLRFTGIQIEVGDKVTPFEQRSFGEELNLCERYFQQYECSGQQLIYFESNTSNHKFTHTNIQRKMRTTPTISLSTNFGHGGGAGGTINSVTTTSIGPDRVSYRVGFTGNIGDQYSLRHSDSFDGDVVSYDAEL